VDIALGLPAVPEQTDSQGWLRGSLASQKHDIILLAPLMWTEREKCREAGKAGESWDVFYERMPAGITD